MKKISFLYFVLAIFMVSCGESQEEKIKPKVLDLTESVYSSVTVQPDSLYQVFSSANGILDNLLVTEGDLVTVGTPIAQIINTIPELNSQNAKLALNLAQQNAGKNSTVLGNILDEIKTAELKAKNDSVNYVRQQNLKKQGVGTQAEYDARKLAYETSKTSIKILKDKYARTKLELQTSLNQATNQYKSAITSTKDFTVKSKIFGKVYEITKEAGELVSIQTPIAKIGSRNNFIIEMLIDEVDITRIEINQTILITLDAYPKQVFEATITKIYPAKNERTQTFKIEGVFTKRPKILYPGLTGEANIVILSKKNVLTIPNEYLNEDKMVNTDDGLVKVKTGIKNLERTEIISGIDSNTYLYKLKQ